MRYSYLFFILICTTVVAQNKFNTITGKWMSTDNNLIVEVYQVNNEYCAKVVWFDDTDDKTRPYTTRLDERNPDINLRQRKIVGLEVMHGLVYNASTEEWDGGRIYDANKGKMWNAKAWLDKDGYLNIRGFWHFEFLGQDISFKKVQ